jgi:hypothetical protein
VNPGPMGVVLAAYERSPGAHAPSVTLPLESPVRHARLRAAASVTGGGPCDPTATFA